MARFRVLTDEERVIRNRENRRKWRERNAEATRVAKRKASMDPTRLRQFYDSKRARRQEDKEILLALGWKPNPVGRPREPTSNAAEETVKAKRPPRVITEEQRARLRQWRKLYREKLKATGYSFSQSIGWTKDWEEKREAIKAFRETAKTSAFRPPSTLEPFFSCGKVNQRQPTPTITENPDEPSTRDDKENS